MVPQSHESGARPRAPSPPSLDVPPADRCQVWIDFDGTITAADVLDELIRRHAVGESWLAVEAEWQQGLIGSRDCLSRQLATVRATDAELDALLADIPLDPGVARLFALLASAGVPVAVLSDGIDRFIAHLMNRAGLPHVPVRSNAIARHGDTMDLRCPHGSADCRSAAAHCKCHSMVALATTGRDCHLYIGDGRSDLCPARWADVVFAKGVLAANLSAEGVAFVPFETLGDVADALAAAWEPSRPPSVPTRAGV